MWWNRLSVRAEAMIHEGLNFPQLLWLNLCLSLVIQMGGDMSAGVTPMKTWQWSLLLLQAIQKQNRVSLVCYSGVEVRCVACSVQILNKTLFFSNSWGLAGPHHRSPNEVLVLYGLIKPSVRGSPRRDREYSSSSTSASSSRTLLLHLLSSGCTQRCHVTPVNRTASSP